MYTIFVSQRIILTRAFSVQTSRKILTSATPPAASARFSSIFTERSSDHLNYSSQRRNLHSTPSDLQESSTMTSPEEKSYPLEMSEAERYC